MTDDQVDHSRRRLLTAATVGTGAIGAVFAAAPFLASWNPSMRAKALIDQLGSHDALLADPKSEDSEQPDYIKAQGAARARNPQIWVGVAVCTHLGCSPLGAFEANDPTQLAGVDLGANWPGGFYCPCHGSKYDISGRVFKAMPAPKNLPVPPYAFVGQTMRIIIGVDDAKSV